MKPSLRSLRSFAAKTLAAICILQSAFGNPTNAPSISSSNAVQGVALASNGMWLYPTNHPLSSNTLAGTTNGLVLTRDTNAPTGVSFQAAGAGTMQSLTIRALDTNTLSITNPTVTVTGVVDIALNPQPPGYVLAASPTNGAGSTNAPQFRRLVANDGVMLNNGGIGTNTTNVAGLTLLDTNGTTIVTVTNDSSAFVTVFRRTGKNFMSWRYVSPSQQYFAIMDPFLVVSNTATFGAGVILGWTNLYTPNTVLGLDSLSRIYSLDATPADLSLFHTSTNLGDILSGNGSTRTNTSLGANGQVLSADHATAGGLRWIDLPIGGTVTSIGLSLTDTNTWNITAGSSPVTSAGTIAITNVFQSAGRVYAGPASGSAAAPTWRTLVSADIPAALDTAKLGVGTVDTNEFAQLDGARTNLQGQIDALASGGSITNLPTYVLTNHNTTTASLDGGAVITNNGVTLKLNGADANTNNVLEVKASNSLAFAVGSNGTTTASKDFSVLGNLGVTNNANVIGSVTAASFSGAFSGDGSGLLNLTANNISGVLPIEIFPYVPQGASAALSNAVANANLIATNFTLIASNADVISSAGNGSWYRYYNTNALGTNILRLQSATNDLTARVETKQNGSAALSNAVANANLIATNFTLIASNADVISSAGNGSWYRSYNTNALGTNILRLQSATNDLTARVETKQAGTYALSNAVPNTVTNAIIGGTNINIRTAGGTNFIDYTGTSGGSSGSRTNTLPLTPLSAFFPTTNQPLLSVGSWQYQLLFPQTNATGAALDLYADWAMTVPNDYTTNTIKLWLYSSINATNGPNTSNLIWRVSILRVDTNTDVNVGTFSPAAEGTNTLGASYNGTNLVSACLIDLSTNSPCGPGDLIIFRLERNQTNDTYRAGAGVFHSARVEYKSTQ